MREVVVYGIPNCDQVRRARTWFDDQGIAYVFRDLRKTGLEPDRLARWLAVTGRDRLINRQGTTWRGLDEASRAAVVDDASAMTLMLAKLTLIKRPIVECGTVVLVGFDAPAYLAALAR